MGDSLTVQILPDTFAICRLSPLTPLPEWFLDSEFFSVTKGEKELSVVCSADILPEGLTCNSGWRCLRVVGPLDFSLTGILSSLASPLADAAISIFAISTHDTDYLMVKSEQFDEAIHVLQDSGHQIAPVK
ncbi:MAG: ACT domain-containing protein [Chloroflexota bacterium]|nr:ACT domain-containing protein [Chloroflexota bacterium]